MRTIHPLIAVASAALLAACDQSYPPPPDYTPVGTGLSVIGLGIVIAAVVIAIFKSGGGDHE